MGATTIAAFLEAAQEMEKEPWDQSVLEKVAQLQVPADLLGAHGWLLEADIRLAWTRWYVDGCLNRTTASVKNFTYAKVYQAVRETLLSRFSAAPADEVERIADLVSEFAWADLSLSRARRTRIPNQTRQELWLAAGPDQRCYLCGYEFSEEAGDAFLDGRALQSSGPKLVVDLTRPRGAKEQDLRVEVDHIKALASGGGDNVRNLRLACGWCNRAKSNKQSIFEASASFYGTCETKELGPVAIPQPLWVVRVVKTRGRCEASAGCAARLDSAELFVAPRDGGGMITPSNFFVACRDHDPWATARWVPPAAIKRANG